MAIDRHGLSVGIERIGKDFFLTLKIIGRLEHNDYETIVPMLESALMAVKDPKINAFIDVTELQGWTARAAWDDLKLGLKHHKEFSKVAVLGSKKWPEFTAKISSWFIAGEAEFFDNSEDAFRWLDI